MNRGGRKSFSAGFTIVETLIVLAVTSALLVSAIVTMSGRQSKTEFQVGRQAMEREFQSAVSQIESGRYSAQQNFSCTRQDIAWYGAYPNINNADNTVEQGANGQCIFTGMALHFGFDSKKYQTWVMAGSREAYGGGSDVATLADSHPRAIGNTYAINTFRNGMTYQGLRYVNTDGTYSTVSSSTQNVVVRLMLSLGGADVLAGKLAGSQKVAVHATEPWNFDVFFTINGAAVEQPKKGVQVCLGSGGTDDSVIYSIGNNWGNKVTSTVVSGNRTCGW